MKKEIEKSTVPVKTLKINGAILIPIAWLFCWWLVLLSVVLGILMNAGFMLILIGTILFFYKYRISVLFLIAGYLLSGSVGWICALFGRELAIEAGHMWPFLWLGCLLVGIISIVSGIALIRVILKPKESERG